MDIDSLTLSTNTTPTLGALPTPTSTNPPPPSSAEPTKESFVAKPSPLSINSTIQPPPPSTTTSAGTAANSNTPPVSSSSHGYSNRHSGMQNAPTPSPRSGGTYQWNPAFFSNNSTPSSTPTTSKPPSDAVMSEPSPRLGGEPSSSSGPVANN
ncbi:hypothetical protein HDU97_005427, partial [Phlyctochytrium planicorne]